jgi:putative exosortase-associated protein (TIGR04073 family)
MRTLFRVYLSAILLAVATTGGAADSYTSPPATNTRGDQPSRANMPVTYGQAISEKLGVGASNVLLSPLEVPKNIINTSNEANVALGITGGVLKGFMHMTFRILSGITDLVSFPIPSEPLTTPKYVWDDFKVETKYNTPLFKMRQLQ